MMKRHTTPRSNGFTLVEVLIAIIVLSIGMLGIASLQATSLKNNYNAYLRTQVIQQVYSLIDRMRANLNTAIDGDYSATAAPTISYDCSSNFTGTAVANKCSTTEMARADLKAWFDALGRVLPSATGEIECEDADATDSISCTRGSIHTITVSWSEQEASRDDDDNVVGTANKSFAMSIQL